MAKTEEKLSRKIEEKEEEMNEASILVLSDDDDDKANESILVLSDDDDEKVAGDTKEEIADIVQSVDRNLNATWVSDKENEDLSVNELEKPLQLHSATEKTAQSQIEKVDDSLKKSGESSGVDVSPSSNILKLQTSTTDANESNNKEHNSAKRHSKVKAHGLFSDVKLISFCLA